MAAWQARAKSILRMTPDYFVERIFAPRIWGKIEAVHFVIVVEAIASALSDGEQDAPQTRTLEACAT